MKVKELKRKPPLSSTPEERAEFDELFYSSIDSGFRPDDETHEGDDGDVGQEQSSDGGEASEPTEVQARIQRLTAELKARTS